MRSVSLIIPHRDDHTGLVATLEAVARLSAPVGWSLETIIVDNSSDTASEEFEELIARCAPPGTRLIKESQVGAAPARNAGFAASSGEVIAFLDCDCSPGRDWLQRALEALERCDVVGGPVTVALPGGRPPETPAEAVDLLFGFNSRLSFERDGMLPTGNMAAHRRVIEAVGPFRQRVSEDRDWSVRAAALGYRLTLDASLGLTHAAVNSEAKLHARWTRITTETYHFLRAHGHGDLHWRAYLAKVAVSPILHVHRLFTDRRLNGCSVRLRLAAARTLFGVRWRRVAVGLRAGRRDGFR